MQQSTSQFQNFEVFKVICQFLDPRELFTIMLTNKTLYLHTIKFFKLLLRQQGLLDYIDLYAFKAQTKGKSLKQQSEVQSRQGDQKTEEIDSEFLAKELLRQKNQNVQVPYNLVYKNFFARETLITTLSAGVDREKYTESLKPFRRAHTYGYAVKKFKVGQRFVAFLTFEDELYYCLSLDFFEKIHQKPQYTKRTGVKKFQVVGRNFMTYLTTSGMVVKVFHDSDTNQVQERPLKITQIVPIQDIVSSYYLNVLVIDKKAFEADKVKETLFKINTFLLSNRLATQEENLPIEVNEEDVFGLVLLQGDITAENLDDWNRYRKIVGYNEESYRSLVVGSQNIYILSQSQKIYQSDLSASVTPNANQNSQFIMDNSNINRDQPIIRLYPNEFFNGKHIVRLYAGMQYFFALAREEVKPIQEWSNKDLIKWLNTNGFEDYSKVVKYNEWEGKEFAEIAINKNFMKETLGLTREDLQIKLSTDINRAQKRTWKGYQLYAWGRNDFGQLGVPLSNNIQIASNVPIPSFDSYDEIETIQCGFKNAVMLTRKGRIFITDTQVKKNEQQQQVQKVEEPVPSNKKNRKKSNIEEDPKQQQQQQGNRKKSNVAEVVKQEQPKMRWLEITQMFTHLKDSREFQKFGICISKDYLAVLCVCVGNQKLTELRKINNSLHKGWQSQQSLPQSEVSKKKFIPAYKILNRILWDPALKHDEFVIGYEDRFLGILEITIDEYQQSEVKDHRIQYFKRNDQIVWDRQKRIDLLNV